MNQLIFATGNEMKFNMASTAFCDAGIELIQEKIDIDEVQSEDGHYVAKKKCEAAYEKIGKPVAVNDDFWSFPGLNGFPGAYMKSMSHWFTVDDWLRLTSDLEDRRAQIIQFVAYFDGKETYATKRIVHGNLLSQARGTSSDSVHSIISLDSDDGLSMAEALQNNPAHYNDRDAAVVWREFASWYKKNKLA